MSIPDAAIEAAAEAIQFVDRSNLNRTARAAIEAAMPAIREAIAQEIETTSLWDVPDSTDEFCFGMRHAAWIVRGGAA